MKKSISLLLIVFTLCSMLPMQVHAADMATYAGAVTTKSTSLNVRSSPSTTSRIVTTLNKGSHITLVSKVGSWWKVEYGDEQQGYCHTDYITVIEGTPARVATQSGSLNVRTGPGTSYSVRTQLPKGKVVIRLSSQNGWSRILYHGTRVGYVSNTYLSSTSQNTTSGAVTLSVPSFKQMDSRWSSVKLGTSGKTIGQIGCVTTSIAMMESYRTGTTIYPDAMSKKLTYTSSGDVYWPSNFVGVAKNANYLQEIAQLLRQGKPVLAGVTNNYGRQQWVVVVGYNGNGYTPENFAINDPGSNTRVTLAQLLSAYPNFYKYFHY